MKTSFLKYITLSCATSLGAYATAQNIDDALRYAQYETQGTARYSAMGGSMGAAGGDLSAISTNPAGIGVYRKSEFAFSNAVAWNNSNAKYYDTNSSSTKTKYLFNQIGLVGSSTPIPDAKQGIISSNFAFSYNRQNNFNSFVTIKGHPTTSSMLNEMVALADDNAPKNLKDREWMAYNTYLINPLKNSSLYFNAYENVDANGKIYSWTQDADYMADAKINQTKLIQTEGNTGEYNFTYGINLSNILYLGASINIKSINYYEKSIYQEDGYVPLESVQDTLPSSFKYSTTLETKGTGVNGKIGLLVQPVAYVRLGASIQTPTWYSMQDTYTANINSWNKTRSWYSQIDDINEYEYQYYAPSIATFSGVAIWPSIGFINVDYELTNPGNAHFSVYSSTDNLEDYDNYDETNQSIEDTYGWTGKMRIGGEIKVMKLLALRAGYMTAQSPYKVGDNKDMTNVTYSAGVGIKHKNLYFDLTYMLNKKEYYHAPYQLTNKEAEEYWVEVPQPAFIKSNTNNIMCTMGFKF